VEVKKVMAALDNLTEQEALRLNRGVLRQLADNELSAELAPYMKNRPLARLGWDPLRASILPHYLPEDRLQWENKNHPLVQTYGGNARYMSGEIAGEYNPPQVRFSNDPEWKQKVTKAYGIPTNDIDRVIAWQNPKNPVDRNKMIRTLVHEAEHRGQFLAPVAMLRKEKEVKEAYLKQKQALGRKDKDKITHADMVKEKNLYRKWRHLVKTIADTYGRGDKGLVGKEALVRISDLKVPGNSPQDNQAYQANLDFLENIYETDDPNILRYGKPKTKDWFNEPRRIPYSTDRGYPLEELLRYEKRQDIARRLLQEQGRR
jgi:hypothetical protein